MMTKEVTKTIVKVAKMEMKDGSPVAVALPDVVILGNVTLEKAQKEINKEYEKAIVLGVEVYTNTYELPVEDFISIAKIKVEKEEVEA